MVRSGKVSKITVRRTKIQIFLYKIYEPDLIKKGTVLFIGPKQVVVYRRLPDPDIINKGGKGIDGSSI